MVANFYDKLCEHTSDAILHTDTYRNMIATLQFLASLSRPDIMLAVNIFAQYTGKPAKYLMKCAKRVFGYLKLTQRFAIKFNLDAKHEDTLTYYTDSNFGGDRMTRKSRSWWIGSFFGFMFLCNSRKQTCTALSTPEAEYIEIYEAWTNTK